MATATPSEAGYEFSAAQNAEFQAVAYWMGIMGRLGVLFSLLAAAVTALAVYNALEVDAAVGAVAKAYGPNAVGVAVGMVVAALTVRAGLAFGRVAKTAGGDIGNVMGAVGNLKRLYRLQAVAIGVVFGLIVAGFVVGAATTR